MLTDMLNIFMQKGIDAIALITPLALGLYGTLVLLDFAWTWIQIVLNNGDNMFKTFVNKTVRYGIYFYIIKNYKMILDQILNSFIKVGLVAGGNTLSKADATDPTYIMNLGYQLMDKMYSFRDLVNQDNGVVNLIIAAAKGELTVAKLFPNFFFWLVSFLIFIAFALIAIQICITWIETYFITSIAVIFLPFAVFRPMAFLAEKAVGAVIGCGAKLMMLLFVIGVSFPILESWQVTGDPNTYESLKLLTCAGTIAFLCWQAPAMTASLMNGSPSLTTGGAAGGIASVAAMAGAAFGMAKMGLNTVKGVGSGISNIMSAEHTIAAAEMAGVSDSSSGIVSPTIPQEKNNAPAGGMTAENIISGIDSGNGYGGSATSDSGSFGNSSVNNAPAGGITAENVASGIGGTSSNKSSSLGISDISTGGSNVTDTPSSMATDSSSFAGNNESSSVSSSHGIADSTSSTEGMKAESTDMGDSSNASASSSKSSSATAANVAGKIALANQITPPENSEDK